MSDEARRHWEAVYAARDPEALSWFQAEPAPSLAMIAATGLTPAARVIDVGAGASLLADRLLDRGFARVTVLDVSSQALATTETRLGDRAAAVERVAADVTAWTPPTGAFDLWHDRAVFHFLVEDAGRRGYVRALTSALKPGGYAILATFSLTGPDRCSGLPVQGYSPATLQAALGPDFQFIEARPETHRTPGGATQDFVWCLFRKSTDE